MPFPQPFRYQMVQLGKMPFEEVIPTGNESDSRPLLDLSGELLDHRSQLVWRTELIELAGYQKLRLIAAAEIRQAPAVKIADRKSEANELGDARVAAPGAQPDPGTETETRNEQRHAGIFHSEKLNRRQDVALLAQPLIVRSFAQAHSAKVESQDGQPKSMNGFSRLVNHLVVHGPAKQRMRMTHDGS